MRLDRISSTSRFKNQVKRMARINELSLESRVWVNQIRALSLSLFCTVLTTCSFLCECDYSIAGQGPYVILSANWGVVLMIEYSILNTVYSIYIPR